MSEEFIPVCTPFLGGRELEYVTEAVQGGWISSSGRFVKDFEAAFATLTNTAHATTTPTGTAAVHLALKALDVGKGDEVVVPDFTMIGSVFPLLYLGATPVFVDAERDTWNIDPNQIERAITPRTKAIMAVHIYGHPCDMKEIRRIADAHDLAVMEDSAEAIGSKVGTQPCGSLGDISAFSFFANKVLTTGEGGMVTTNRKDLYDRCRYFKNLCFPLDGPRNYTHEEVGYNYRFSNVLAAIGLAQTERAEHYAACRRRNAQLYMERLREIEGITLPVEREGYTNSYWMFGVLIEDSFGPARDLVMQRLHGEGIDSRKFFAPMHEQPSLRGVSRFEGPERPISRELSQRGLYLPSGSDLQESQIDRICSSIAEIQKSR